MSLDIRKKSLPFCRIAVFTAILQNVCRVLQLCRKNGNSAVLLPYLAELPMSLAYIFSKNHCRFAVLPFLWQILQNVCRALPVCRKNGNSAELLQCLAEFPMSLFSLKKMQFCRFAVFTAILQSILPGLADMP